MLVLTRRLNESIQLGDDITVTIVSLDADRVRIGIDAPRSMKIYRKELLDEITRTNREAADAPMINLAERLSGGETGNKPDENR